MDHLQSQVTDLRSFLPGTLASPPDAILSPMAGGFTPGRGAHGAHHAHAHHSPMQQQQQQQQQHHSGTHQQRRSGGAQGGSTTAAASSPYSALHGGPNSALPSPTTATPTSAGYAQQQANHTHHAGNDRSHGLSASPGAVDAASSRQKRRAESTTEEAAQKQQRSKRNRYISIACNECKRRKVRCNGETKCERCCNLNLECIYSPNCCSNSFRDSDEFKNMNDSLNLLQDQMETIQRKMTALQQETTMRLAPLQDRVLPLPNATTSHSGPSPSPSTSSAHKPDVPSFRSPVQFFGPTSASSHVNVAYSTLHNMGYGAAEGEEDNGNINMIGDDAGASPALSTALRDTSRRPADPLWEFDQEEVVRLCKVHEEEVGIMYPVVNIEDVIAHAKFGCSFMEAARKSGLANPQFGGQGDGISDIKTLELKIIMCCALVVEEHGHSAKADRLWDSIQPIADKMFMSLPADVTFLPFLALVGGYRFLANEEVLAWRVMGQVTRLCLELGLHRRDGISRIEGEQDRKNAINTFWSAYVLDRRWSFGTGFPFVVQDDKVDPGLPLPEGRPYLTSLIHFAKLSSKIWKLVDYFDSVLIKDLKREDYEEMDSEILAWYETVPDSIRISSLGNHIPVPGTDEYNVERLQIWTRLRLNQIRIWLYTPVLHTATSITENRDLAELVVNLAKETIQYLSLLNNTSEIYRRIQVFYHHFLTSAIAVLFVASTHAPVLFSAQCREQFQMALELVKDLSEDSWVSKRLWRTVGNLKTYAPRLGLQQDEDPRRQARLSHASHRSSVSSGGHHYYQASSSSPGGMTPGGHGSSSHHNNRLSSRVGSMTPHGGEMNSPRSASGSGGMQSHARRTTSRGEVHATNGLLLHKNLSSIYDSFFTSPAVGSGEFGVGEELVNVFPAIKDCF